MNDNHFAVSGIAVRRPQGILNDDLPDFDLLGDQELADRGLIDVTAAPFHADPTGEHDSSNAIQAAVTFGREHKMAVFFPGGTYMISRSIACIAGWTEERTSLRRYLPHCEYWPCVLIGDRRAGVRTRIVLAECAPGFTDPEAPRPMLDFYANNWVRPRHGAAPHPGRQGNVNFHQTLLGFELEIRSGNPGAVCMSFDAAEGSSLQDCRFDAGDGYAGMVGGPGCGGIIVNCDFVGGNYGCIVDSGRPPGTYVGCRFKGQRRCAVRKSDRANLTLVGCEFQLNRGVYAACSYPSGLSSLSLVDCRIDYEPGDVPTFAIFADSAVYLREVFVSNADILVESTPHPRIVGGGGWQHVREAAFPYTYEGQIAAPIYRDGTRSEEPLLDLVPGKQPPQDLCDRHRWGENEILPWNHPRVVDVRRDYGAVGDGKHDDTVALQRAIDENEIVFLPKGAYRISRTLRLRADTCLLGVHAAYSLIAPLPMGDFADPGHPRPVLQTVNATKARTRLAFFCVYMPREIAPGAYFLDWACGGDSLLNCVFPSTGFVRPDFQPLHAGVMPWNDWHWEEIDCAVDQHAFHYTTPDTDCLIAHDPVPNWPLTRVHGHGGGRWYTFVANQGRRHGPRYRRLLVEDISGPLRIYNAVLQNGRGDCELEIRNSRCISIYGIKNEKDNVVAWIHDSADILVSGYSGTGQHNREQKFLLENVPNLTLANVIDDCYRPRPKDAATWMDTSTHHLPHIRERYMGIEDDICTATYERPVLYCRS